mmetsp:Transcript_56409/g.156142  ORF Transcript_56409/g.156142 Transcript_56409/m.156142 type:complete len:237 (+) Transcript_56409:1796-2506(+)
MPCRCVNSAMDASKRGSTRLMKGRSSPAVGLSVSVGNCISLSSQKMSSVMTPASWSSSPVWQLVDLRLQYFKDLPARKRFMSFCCRCWNKSIFSTDLLSRTFIFLRSRSRCNAARCVALVGPTLNFGMLDSYSARKPLPFLPASAAGAAAECCSFLLSFSFSRSMAFWISDIAAAFWSTCGLGALAWPDCGRNGGTSLPPPPCGCSGTAETLGEALIVGLYSSSSPPLDSCSKSSK